MPKSKLCVSLSAEDVPPALNGATAQDSSATLPRGVVPSPEKNHTEYSPNEEHTASVAAGRLPEEVYANTLPWWRAALRRKCVAVVKWESGVIGEWQVRPSQLPIIMVANEGAHGLYRIASGRLG